MLFPVLLFPCVRMGLRVRPERWRISSSSSPFEGGAVEFAEEKEDEAVGAVERFEERLPNGKGISL